MIEGDVLRANDLYRAGGRGLVYPYVYSHSLSAIALFRLSLPHGESGIIQGNLTRLRGYFCGTMGEVAVAALDRNSSAAPDLSVFTYKPA